MAIISKRLVRQQVNAHGLAHTSAFDVRLEGMPPPFDTFMPAIAMTFDRDNQQELESGVPGLPGTTSVSFESRSVQLTMYDTANRDFEKAMLQWRAERSFGLRKAAPSHFGSRRMTISEVYIRPIPGGVLDPDKSLFNIPDLRQAASTTLSRLTSPIEDKIRHRLAKATSDLERQFRSDVHGIGFNDVVTIPNIRGRLVDLLSQTPDFGPPVVNSTTFHVIPVDTLSTSADFTGKGGLSQLELSFRIVGVQKTSPQSPASATAVRQEERNPFANFFGRF